MAFFLPKENPAKNKNKFTMESAIKKTRLLFAGTSPFAEKILSTLLEENFNVVLVILRPEKKSGREQKIIQSPLRLLAEKNNIPCLDPEKITPEIIAEIKKYQPDLSIVAAYGKILPESFLQIPSLGALNIHPSLLPKYRGPSPIQSAILAGEQETGTTLMLMDKGMDSGNIIAQEKIAIPKDDLGSELSNRLSKLSSHLLLETLPRWIKKEISSIKQDEASATLCSMIKSSDGKIFWNKKAEEIYNRYRAFSPRPGIFSFWQKGKELKKINLKKINLSAEILGKNIAPGTIVERDGQILVATGLGTIEIQEIQIEGKKPVPIKNFINGYPNFVGSVLN